MLNVVDALELINNSVVPTSPVSVPIAESLECILATDIESAQHSPPFDKSMMDGYAVRAGDLQAGVNKFKVIGEVTAGRESPLVVEPGQAIRIMTGAPLPLGTDAVVALEQCRMLDDDNVGVELNSPVLPGHFVIKRGANLQAGQTVLEAGQRVRPQEIALLAELGQSLLSVRKPPRVAILATGDELVEVHQEPGAGQIRNSNASMLAAQVQSCGAAAVVLGIARDVRAELREKIERGLECDILCLSGGVSAGKLDLVPAELEAAGVTQIFHKVSMKPGKPIWFGKCVHQDSKPCYVFGLPGNPVSSMVCFELFVRTAIRKLTGQNNVFPEFLQAELISDFTQRGDRDVWFPSQIAIDQGRAIVAPTRWKGSSDLRSTVEANSSACFAAGDRIYRAGEVVPVLLWSGCEIASRLTNQKSLY